MSAIAHLLNDKRIKIYGSDISFNKQIDNLIKSEILTFSKDGNKKFVDRCDAVIYSSAIPNDNKDLIYAKKINKKIFSRAEILGELSSAYKTISIAGAHGKTTSTGLVYNVLKQNYHPTLHIGGVLKDINSNVVIGNDNIFVTEACEFKDNFLSLKSNIAVILNIKPEHLDYFKTLENEINSYQKFASNTCKDGFLILNNDDDNCKNIKCSHAKIVTFAIKNNADIKAENIIEYVEGKYKFDCIYKNKNLGQIYLSCYGKHNIYNALVAILIGLIFEIEFEKIKNGIETFKGIERRFEIIKQNKYSMIIHDYAHHPDEIDANINLCRELKKEKLIVIFQPHTFTRTHDLYNQFISSLSRADEVWLLPIYPAREKAIKGVSSYNLKKDLKNIGVDAKYFKNFLQCKQEIIKLSHTNTVFLILGAGDIVELAYQFYKS